MILPPSLRKFTLAVHLAISVGWIGAVIVYLALSVAAMTTDDAATLSAAWIGMDLAGRYAIVPLAIASLVTGIVMALGTKWGLFRHYWVAFSLLMTVLATVVLLLHMPDVTVLADAAQELTSASREEPGMHLYARLQGGDLLHPGLGLIVLLTIQVLNVYKPRGLTRYGQRKVREQQAETAV
jgi:hypothetical protein